MLAENAEKNLHKIELFQNIKEHFMKESILLAYKVSKKIYSKCVIKSEIAIFICREIPCIQGNAKCKFTMKHMCYIAIITGKYVGPS